MTGTELVGYIKAKLNRIDTNSYEDVRREEVIFYANEALKSLTLEFDLGIYSKILDAQAINIYLGSLTASQAEAALTNNTGSFDPNDVLKFKDVEAEVTIGTETGWVSAAREMTNNKTSDREDNPFRKAFPDTPTYRFIDNVIKFDASNFTCNKWRYDYLKYPPEITLGSTLTYSFLNELQDKTVTLLLENLEAQRLQTQPAVSRS